MAFVIRRPDANVDADSVSEYLLARVESNQLSRYAVPEAERVVFVSEIPKTGVGKIDKKVLRARNRQPEFRCSQSC
jgi:fatty-acyl-CoA synthase